MNIPCIANLPSKICHCHAAVLRIVSHSQLGRPNNLCLCHLTSKRSASTQDQRASLCKGTQRIPWPWFSDFLNRWCCAGSAMDLEFRAKYKPSRGAYWKQVSIRLDMSLCGRMVSPKSIPIATKKGTPCTTVACDSQTFDTRCPALSPDEGY